MDEPCFVIGGESYPVPTRESLDLDEHVIFYEWTGVDLETIDDTPVNGRMIGAFMQMAYMRANPGVSPQLARKLIGKSNFEAAIAAFAASEQEDDASPPEQRQSGDGQPGSPVSRSFSQPTSGTDSTTSSDPPANGHPDSGVLQSATSATFVQLTSEK